jgi:hypothetical protein
VLGTPVAFRHAEIVLQRVVGSRKRILQLVALEQVIVAPRLVRRTVLWIDGPADGPKSSVLALDPDDNGLLGASVVYTVDDSLGEAALR